MSPGQAPMMVESPSLGESPPRWQREQGSPGSRRRKWERERDRTIEELGAARQENALYEQELHTAASEAIAAQEALEHCVAHAKAEMAARDGVADVVLPQSSLKLVSLERSLERSSSQAHSDAEALAEALVATEMALDVALAERGGVPRQSEDEKIRSQMQSDAEVHRLRTELAEAEEENRLLAKTLACSSEPAVYEALDLASAGHDFCQAAKRQVLKARNKAVTKSMLRGVYSSASGLVDQKAVAKYLLRRLYFSVAGLVDHKVDNSMLHARVTDLEDDVARRNAALEAMHSRNRALYLEMTQRDAEWCARVRMADAEVARLRRGLADAWAENAVQADEFVNSLAKVQVQLSRLEAGASNEAAAATKLSMPDLAVAAPVAEPCTRDAVASSEERCAQQQL